MVRLAKEEILEVVLQVLETANQARGADEQLDVSPQAVLYTANSVLDSLGLVALLMDIEDSLRDKGVEVSLNNERAMSQANSPFRDVPALVEYIALLLA